ncbi:MAG: Hsp20/alpha crystallin family protein [Desulfobacteraceae bacterium]
MSESKEMQVRNKQEAASAAEQTKPGVIFTPAVDIFETEESIFLIGDMPGVKNEDLTIDLRDNTLTLTGDVSLPEADDEEVLLYEYGIGRYYRQFTLSEVVDQEKIDATLKNGVLHLTLPKAERARPRQIEVKAQ